MGVCLPSVRPVLSSEAGARRVFTKSAACNLIFSIPIRLIYSRSALDSLKRDRNFDWFSLCNASQYFIL